MPRKPKISRQTVNDTLQEVLRKLELFQSAPPELDGISAAENGIPEARTSAESRFGDLEAEMKAVRLRLDNLEGLYEQLDRKVETLDQEYVSMRAALKRLGQRFNRLEAGRLHDRLRNFEEKIAALEKSIVN